MANDVQFDDILDIDDWDAIASINGFSAQPLEALWGGPEVDIRSFQAYDVQGSIARGRDSGSTKGRGRLYTVRTLGKTPLWMLGNRSIGLFDMPTAQDKSTYKVANSS